MNNDLIKPQKLSVGDTICLISPAAGLAGLKDLGHRADSGSTCLRNMGFNVIEGAHARIPGERSGNGLERAQDIHDALKDPAVKAIISMIGSDYVCAEILPHLDYDLIKRHPKIIMGYSDVTSLLLGVYTKTGVVTFYGPAIMTQFAEFPDILSYTKKWFEIATMRSGAIGPIAGSLEWTEEQLDWTRESDLTRPRKMNKSSGWEWLQGGKASGTLIGGCVQIFPQLIDKYPGYLPDFTNSLFFWESAEKELGAGHTPDEVIADLEKIKSHGIFEKMTGMIVGRPYFYSEEWHESLKKMIVQLVDDPSKPILYNVEIGHTDPILTIPIGVNATIDANAGTFIIDDSAVLEP